MKNTKFLHLTPRLLDFKYMFFSLRMLAKGHKNTITISSFFLGKIAHRTIRVSTRLTLSTVNIALGISPAPERLLLLIATVLLTHTHPLVLCSMRELTPGIDNRGATHSLQGAARRCRCLSRYKTVERVWDHR